MVSQVVEFLRPAPGQTFVDATVGAGGHARELLKLTAPDGQLLGIDWDEEAIALARKTLAEYGPRVTLVQENFANLTEVLAKAGPDFLGVDGVLFDLGVSSLQLDKAERGFSFKEDGPLDMRMDRRQPTTAAQVVNDSTARELEEIFHRLGEERWARRIAQAIAEARKKEKIIRTKELAKVVVSAIPAAFRHGPIHAATRTFQALRLTVNQELENLRKGLRAATAALKPGGRGVVISYHSLEDGIVKREFATLERGCICPPGQTFCTCGRVQAIRVINKRPIEPSAEEIKENPRSRSAKLRAVEKLT